MKFLICALAFFLGSIGYGQDTTKLSKDNGFKHFKYNTTPDDYSDINRMDKNVGTFAVYSYLWYNEISFADIQSSGVFLFFKENKVLTRIEVQFDFESEAKFRKVLMDLESIYGESTNGVVVAVVMQVNEFIYWEDGNYNLELILLENNNVIVKYHYVEEY